MGGGFAKTRTIDCNGQLVTNQLNQVFRNPGTPQYQAAQAHNTFGAIQNVQGNWKDLIIAYLRAGVDVGNEFPAWVAYLEQLGAGATGTQGPLNIYLIAPDSQPAPGNGYKHGPERQTGSHGARIGRQPKHDRFALPALD